jgi:HAE1 family hydrophobic/amphiphilic exporter-1
MSSVIVFLPLVLGDASSDDMYTLLVPLGTTFVSALLASLLVSQTLVPLVTRRVFKEDKTATRHPLLDALGSRYAKLIDFTLRWPKATVFFGLCLCATAALPASQLNFDFEPQEKSISLPIQLEFTGSTTHELVESRIIGVEDALLPRKGELGIESLACQFRDWRGNCDVYSSQDIESEDEMSTFHQRIASALPEQPGVRYRINERDGWRHRSRDPRVVGFAVRGEDVGKLMKMSNDIADRLRERLDKGDPKSPEAGGYDQITGPFNEGSRELHIELDTDRLRQYGLDANSVASFVSMAFSGVPMGELRGAEGQVSLRMTSAGGKNPTRADLEDLRVPTPAGGEIPLTSLGDLTVERSPWWVQRVNRQTEVRMSVRFFSADKGNRGAVMSAVESVKLPDGYSAGERTRWWDRGEQSYDLFINIGLSLVLVYAVMASLFESVLHPLGILVTCLLGCVGAPWMMWLTGTTVDMVATIGLLILIGIVVNNGIMLVDLVTQLRVSGLSRREALIQAGRDRLRPILMTASTTILGLLPMLIHHPTLAGVYYHGIAIIVAGGLLTSTLMTLLFLPAAYGLLEDFAAAIRRSWLQGRKAHLP